jgi:hypothetical protein
MPGRPGQPGHDLCDACRDGKDAVSGEAGDDLCHVADENGDSREQLRALRSTVGVGSVLLKMPFSSVRLAIRQRSAEGPLPPAASAI